MKDVEGETRTGTSSQLVISSLRGIKERGPPPPPYLQGSRERNGRDPDPKKERGPSDMMFAREGRGGHGKVDIVREVT